MASTNLRFFVSMVRNLNYYLLLVIFDDMAAFAMSFCCFISMLVEELHPTQYALLASLGQQDEQLQRHHLGFVIVKWRLGYIFYHHGNNVIPSLIFLYMIRHKINLND